MVDVLFVSASLLPSFGYSPALPMAWKVGTGREKDLAAAGFNKGKKRSIQLVWVSGGQTGRFGRHRDRFVQ